MTRINAGVDPRELPRQLLLAEHREIIRIPNMIRAGRVREESLLESRQLTFRLGTGHVKFFYTRCGYLRTRYKALHAECLSRGYDVLDYEIAFRDLPACADQYHYLPSFLDREIIIARIESKGFTLNEVSHRRSYL